MTMNDLIEGLVRMGNPKVEPRSKIIRREIIENLFSSADGELKQDQTLNRVHGEMIAAGDCWLIMANGAAAPSRIVVLDSEKRTMVCHDIKAS